MIGVKATQTDLHKAIVRVGGRGAQLGQLDTNIVVGKSVERHAVFGVLGQHLALLPDISGVEGLTLLLREPDDALAAGVLFAFVHDIGDAERGSART